MRFGLAALLLAACAPKPAEPLEALNAHESITEPLKARHVEPRLAAPRPPLDVTQLVPDFHDDLRWPLTAMSHPSLEPRFAIAPVFADPGIGWLELCKRGVHKRITGGRNRDELDYLRGWCSASAGDIDTACGTLAPLVSSAVLGISPAVRIDLANIIVDAGHADRAEHWLSKHAINDVQILDTLAATYVEVGGERDAYEINRRAMDSDNRPSQETQCRRLIKHIVLGPEGERALPVAQLTQLATKPKLPDPTCKRLFDAWQCASNPARDCIDYLRDAGIDTKFQMVLRAYHHWPTGHAPLGRWLSVVEDARFAVALPEALELTLTALETAARVGGACSYETYQVAIEIEKLMDTMLTQTPERIKRVRASCGDTFSRPKK